MVGWNSTQKRWKRAADAAIAPAQFDAERDRLAAEVAKRIWVANGGREWADARGEGSLVALETLVLRHLHDAVVRTSAALRYVSVLEDSERTADYEDVRSVDAERRWVEEYLQGSTQSSLLPTEGDSGSGMRETAGERLDRMRAHLTGLLMKELKTASIAAA